MSRLDKRHDDRLGGDPRASKQFTYRGLHDRQQEHEPVGRRGAVLGVLVVVAMVVLFVVISSGKAAGAAGDPAAGPSTAAEARVTPQQVAALVKQLGAADYNEREQATAALTKIGTPALPALREAMKSDDPEVAARARQIAQTITGGPGWEDLVWREELGEDPVQEILAADRLLIARHKQGRVATMRTEDGQSAKRNPWDGLHVRQIVQADDIMIASLDKPEVIAGWGLSPDGWEKAWQTDLAGIVSIAAAGKHVVALVHEGKLTLRCMDKASGATVWTAREVAGGKDVRMTASADAVITASSDGQVAAYRRSDGQPLWQAKLNVTCTGQPVAVGSSVVIPCKGKAIALDARTGTQLWEHSVGGDAAVRTPAVTDAGICLSWGGTVAMLKPSDGKPAWSHEHATDDGTRNVVIRGKNGQVIQGVQIRIVVGGGGAMVVKGSSVNDDALTPPAVHGRLVCYGSEDGLVILDATSGEQVQRLSTPLPVKAQPVIRDGVVHFATAMPTDSDQKKAAADKGATPMLYAVGLPTE